MESSVTRVREIRMTDKQIVALVRLCTRYGQLFNPHDFIPQFDLPTGYVAGWVGEAESSIFVGCSPEGEISS